MGTEEGGYLFSSDEGRRSWRRAGPFLAGESVNSVRYSPDDGRLYAATLTEGVFASESLGRRWVPLNRGLNVRKVWTVEVDPRDSCRLYAGTHYGHLFSSGDRGKSWLEVSGLHTAPGREKWGIDWGFGTTGLCVHTIAIDPSDSRRIYVVPAGNGTYMTEDGGETWSHMQNGVMDYCPVMGEEDAPDIPTGSAGDARSKHLREVHRCTHKLALSAKKRGTVYQQNHCGVYATTDGGRSWRDVSPSNSVRHGFGISLVEDRERSVYIVPAYQGVCKKHNSCIRGRLEVFRLSGSGWTRLSNGLPSRVHTCVLRDAVSSDTLHPGGVYFGTTTGELYGSPDGGESWSEIARDLGRIQGVCAFAVE